MASDPPSGVASLVGFPSFVTVSNWTGTVTDEECFGLLCVEVEATPSTSWSPGEPDTAPVACEGPGVRFDPNGPPPELQAADPQTCTHEFGLRTGVEGRPGEWPGSVTVTWDLEWSSTSGTAGTLEPVEKSTPVGRVVDEVQTVVDRRGS